MTYGEKGIAAVGRNNTTTERTCTCCAPRAIRSRRARRKPYSATRSPISRSGAVCSSMCKRPTHSASGVACSVASRAGRITSQTRSATRALAGSSVGNDLRKLAPGAMSARKPSCAASNNDFSARSYSAARGLGRSVAKRSSPLFTCYSVWRSIACGQMHAQPERGKQKNGARPLSQNGMRMCARIAAIDAPRVC